MNKFIFSMGSGYSVLKRCSGTSFTQILIPFFYECHLNFQISPKNRSKLLIVGRRMLLTIFSKIKEKQNDSTI